jgi:DNA-binding MarR family transcriptional regulator
MKDLFDFISDSIDKALARSDDPVTSHAAADSVNVSRLEGIVLATIKQSPCGLIIDEIVDRTSLDKVTVSPRLRPLCKKGLVIESDETRPGKSGRRQTIWLAA